jgi:hypothetical protein
MKRTRELDQRAQQQERDARRAQRKVDKAALPKPDNGEDPDLAGIVPGPQAPLWQDD